jgi:hypothetical protein
MQTISTKAPPKRCDQQATRDGATETMNTQMAAATVIGVDQNSVWVNRRYETASRLKTVLAMRAVQHRTLPCTDARLFSELTLLTTGLSYHPQPQPGNTRPQREVGCRTCVLDRNVSRHRRELDRGLALGEQYDILRGIRIILVSRFQFQA